jgi:hypothetical protein
MTALFWALLGFAAGLALGKMLPMTRSAAPSGQPRRAEPLDHDEYKERRGRLDRGYTESMNQYDRLVTWASGGALVVSVTLLDKFGGNASPETAWILGASWLLLALSLLTSLTSQYTSSRVYSWRTRELDHLQKPPAEDAEKTVKVGWGTEAARLDRVAARWGKLTKWLNPSSGLLLVGGLMLMSGFAFLNAPFRSPSSVGGAPSGQQGERASGSEQERPPAPEPVKKGNEDLGEPVRRPPTPPPPEKR